jgi:ABC-type nitrate/sulfonate/bicarbonate transport system ATPase subunit
MLVVAHDVEEAVLFGDRVIVLGKNSGQIEHDYTIDLPRPRDRIAPQVYLLIGLSECARNFDVQPEQIENENEDDEKDCSKHRVKL